MAADKTLACHDCGAEFVFTAGEQEFFAQKGFSDPTRCPALPRRTQDGADAPAERGNERTDGWQLQQPRRRDRDRRGGRDDEYDYDERPRRGRW